MAENKTKNESWRRRQEIRRIFLSLRNKLATESSIDKTIAANVEKWLNAQSANNIGFYWPIRGEIDLREVISRWLAKDSSRKASLPVIENDQMIFRFWNPNSEMQSGIFNIPTPKNTEQTHPEIVFVACVGFDDQGYRLGYGAGWFDKTLKDANIHPTTVGVAYEDCGIKSINPQPHDIPMDWIITELRTIKSNN